MPTYEVEILHRVFVTAVEWIVLEALDEGQASDLVESELDSMGAIEHLELVIEEDYIQDQEVEDHSSEIGGVHELTD